MSTTIESTSATPVLEPAAESFVEATAKHPFIFELPPAEGRKILDDLQSGKIDEPEIDEKWITVTGGPTGEVRARIVKPQGATGTLPVVFYIHGAGWAPTRSSASGKKSTMLTAESGCFHRKRSSHQMLNTTWC